VNKDGKDFRLSDWGTRDVPGEYSVRAFNDPFGEARTDYSSKLSLTIKGRRKPHIETCGYGKLLCGRGEEIHETLLNLSNEVLEFLRISGLDLTPYVRDKDIIYGGVHRLIARRINRDKEEVTESKSA